MAQKKKEVTLRRKNALQLIASFDNDPTGSSHGHYVTRRDPERLAAVVRLKAEQEDIHQDVYVPAVKKWQPLRDAYTDVRDIRDEYEVSGDPQLDAAKAATRNAYKAQEGPGEEMRVAAARRKEKQLQAKQVIGDDGWLWAQWFDGLERYAGNANLSEGERCQLWRDDLDEQAAAGPDAVVDPYRSVGDQDYVAKVDNMESFLSNADDGLADIE